MSKAPLPLMRNTAGFAESSPGGEPERETLLRQRAEMLARRRREDTRVGTFVRALTVSDGGNRWALPLDGLGAIFPLTSLAWIPGAPAALLGVASDRGELVGVYSLGALLGSSVPDTNSAAYALNVRHADRRVAIAVERVEGIAEFEIEALSAPSSDAGASSPAIVGVSTMGTILLNAESLLERISLTGERQP